MTSIKNSILTTDESNFVVGAVLRQMHSGIDLPVAYASTTHNATETRLSQRKSNSLSCGPTNISDH